MGADLLPVSMFWMDPRLSTLETGCMLSALRAGHGVTLFSYEKLSNLPTGIQWENAASVLPRENFIFYRGRGPAPGSNLFRYRLMEQQRGLWLDTDMLVLKPIVGDGTEIFGWQNQMLINSAALFLPPHSPVLRDLLAFTLNLQPHLPFLDRRDRLKIAPAGHRLSHACVRHALGLRRLLSGALRGVRNADPRRHIGGQPHHPRNACGSPLELRPSPVPDQQARITEPGAGIHPDSFVGKYFIHELGVKPR